MLPFPSQRIFPTQGSNPGLPRCRQTVYWLSHQGSPLLKGLKTIKSCQTLCYPMDCSLPGFSVHGIFPGKNTAVGCHFLLQGIFLTKDHIRVSGIGRWIPYPWPIWKVLSMLFFKTLPSHKLLIISSALILGAAGTGEWRGETGWHSSWETWGQVCSGTFQTWWKRDDQINRLIWRSLWSLKINYLIENDLFESWDQTLKPEKSKPHSWWFWGFILLNYNNIFEMRCYLIMIQLI